MSAAKDRLNQVLLEEGRDPKKSLGQNFLVNDRVIEKIMEAVDSFDCQSLIEIGPGPGSLTFFLAQKKRPLLLIELDSGWAEYWRKKNMSLLEQDALRVNWKTLGGPGVLLVSNLPYQISSSLVIDRCLDFSGIENDQSPVRVPLKGMVLMFQKEVAQKIRGTPHSEHYGLLSVMAQAYWKIETVTDAGSGDFWPPPKVSSRVLKFSPLLKTPHNPEKFLKFVKTAFHQRRKLLKTNWEDHLNHKKEGWKILLQELIRMGFKETLRAEEMSPRQFIELYQIWESLS
jgi:16S rRNA (adenine1518-N6/adenine1519-N6)-dimethyltransferase